MLARTAHPRLVGLLCVLMLASCSSDEGGSPSNAGSQSQESAVIDLPSPPDPNDGPDEIIAACNALVLHIRAFDDVSNGLLEPGNTVEKAAQDLDESQAAFVSDADAFKSIGEAGVALKLGKLADAIGSLKESIVSSGSVQAGVQTELDSMQAAVVVLGQVGATCP